MVVVGAAVVGAAGAVDAGAADADTRAADAGGGPASAGETEALAAPATGAGAGELAAAADGACSAADAGARGVAASRVGACVAEGAGMSDGRASAVEADSSAVAAAAELTCATRGAVGPLLRGSDAVSRCGRSVVAAGRAVDLGSAVSDAADASAEAAGTIDRSAGVGVAVAARAVTTSGEAGWSPEASAGATPGAATEGDAGLADALRCAAFEVMDGASEAFGRVAFNVAARSRAAACTTCGGGGGEGDASGRRGRTSPPLSAPLKAPAGPRACAVTTSGETGWSPEAFVGATPSGAAEGDAGLADALRCAAFEVMEGASEPFGRVAFKVAKRSCAVAWTTCGGGGGEGDTSARRGRASLLLSNALKAPVGPRACAVTTSGEAGWSPEAFVGATPGAAAEGDAGPADALGVAASAVTDGASEAFGRVAFKVAARSRAAACTTCGRGGEGDMSGRRGRASPPLSDPLKAPAGPRACMGVGAGAPGSRAPSSTARAGGAAGALKDGDGRKAATCRGRAGLPTVEAASEATRVGSAVAGLSRAADGRAAWVVGELGVAATDDGRTTCDGWADGGRGACGLAGADARGATRSAAVGDADGVARWAELNAAISSLAGEAASADAVVVSARGDADVAGSDAGAVAGSVTGAVAAAASDGREARITSDACDARAIRGPAARP